MMPNKVKRRRKIQTESGVSRQLIVFLQPLESYDANI